MASPDLTPYIDPPLTDLGTQSIFDRALSLARARLPGWEPDETNTEVVLLEALALVVSETVFTINRLPSALVEAVLGRLFEIPRDPGAYPVGQAQFTVTTTDGHTVPAGTRVTLETGSQRVEFRTDSALLIPVGSTSGSVAITGTTFTVLANGTQPGTRLSLTDSVAFVDAVSVSSTLKDGRLAESVDQYLDRGVTRLRRLVSTLVLPQHFTLAALADPSVERATTVDLYNPTGGRGPGQDPGHVSVAVLGPDRLTLDVETKEALRRRLQAETAAYIIVHVVDPTLTAVNVSVTVHPVLGAEAATVQERVQVALTDYLNPDTWPWVGVVRRNELIALISGVEGVDYVVNLAEPVADLALLGAASLASPGSVTVTVQ